MIQLGRIQKLEAVRQSDFGMYLGFQGESDDDAILLPRKQVPEGTVLGDQVEVFVYKDTEDRLIATTIMPKVTVDQIASLEVVETTKIGAFLDWGLQKDLLLPFKQQLVEVQKGDQCLVTVYVDKSERLCATMKIYNALSVTAPYSQNEKVTGVVYSIKPELGVFVAVDHKYHGLIPRQEVFGTYKVGDQIEARVKKIREDGKLELSVRKQAYQQMEDDAKRILTKLDEEGKKLALNDSSEPAQIKRELNMSKGAFKRAVGRLLKEGAIKITDTGIEKLW